MRITYAFIILILNLQSWVLAEGRIDELFGVKLNTDVSLYANVEDGIVSDGVSTNEIIYTFTNKKLTNIQRDVLFQFYGIRTDKNYKVKVLNAGKYIIFHDKEFSDEECNNQKNNFVDILTAELDLNSSKFKNFYRKKY